MKTKRIIEIIENLDQQDLIKVLAALDLTDPIESIIDLNDIVATVDTNADFFVQVGCYEVPSRASSGAAIVSFRCSPGLKRQFEQLATTANASLSTWARQVCAAHVASKQTQVLEPETVVVSVNS